MIFNLEFYTQPNNHQVRGTITTFPDMQSLKNFTNHASLSQQSNGPCLLPKVEKKPKRKIQDIQEKKSDTKAKANSPKTVKEGAPKMTTMDRTRNHTGQK